MDAFTLTLLVFGALVAALGIDYAVNKARAARDLALLSERRVARRALQEHIRRMECLLTESEKELNTLRAELTRLGGPVEEEKDDEVHQ